MICEINLLNSETEVILKTHVQRILKVTLDINNQQNSEGPF